MDEIVCLFFRRQLSDCLGSLALASLDVQVDQMEMEAKGKAKLMIKVRAYKGEIKGFKSKVVSLLGVGLWRAMQGTGSATGRAGVQQGIETIQQLISNPPLLLRPPWRCARALVLAIPTSLRFLRRLIALAPLQTSLSAVSDRDLLLAQPAHSSYAMDVDDDDTSFNSPAAAQRTRLLASQQTLQNSSGRLENAERTAAESETIGGSILDQLRGQRVQLQGANDELQEADGSIAKASNTIKKMARL